MLKVVDATPFLLTLFISLSVEKEKKRGSEGTNVSP
jgi:hypothetical protein